MKNPKAFAFTSVLLLSTLLETPPAFAERGDKEGNGGGAIVCTDGSGIVSAKLLDLREAEQDGLTIIRSFEPRSVQLENALKKLEAVNPALVEKMRIVLQGMPSITRPAEGRLAPPNDTRLKKLKEPRNCSLEGVASYDDNTETLEIDTEITRAMEKKGYTDLAALDFHEALYKVQREGASQAMDSMKARKLTGAVFATEPLRLESTMARVENAKTVCESKDSQSQFYVIELPSGEYRVQFTRIASEEMMELVYSDFGPQDPLFAKLARGLVKNERELRKTDPAPKQGFFQRWSKGDFHWVGEANQSFALLSDFSPDYQVSIRVRDITLQQSVWYTKPPHFVENARVALGMKGAAAVEVTCRSL